METNKLEIYTRWATHMEKRLAAALFPHAVLCERADTSKSASELKSSQQLPRKLRLRWWWGVNAMHVRVTITTMCTNIQ